MNTDNVFIPPRCHATMNRVVHKSLTIVATAKTDMPTVLDEEIVQERCILDLDHAGNHEYSWMEDVDDGWGSQRIVRVTMAKR